MPRYFIEVAYKGTNYSGSQKQKNANSIQGELENALKIFFKQPFNLTGASRTDAGVHALQNFFHFDTEILLQGYMPAGGNDLKEAVYRVNAILPWDITIINLLPVTENAHCRYDAVERKYKYFIYWEKNPFVKDRAYFFPYKLKYANLEAGAAIITARQNFTAFSKRSTQTHNFLCSINESCWTKENSMLIYTVTGNRFLRGMVRGLVATMLKLGRELVTENEFQNIFDAGNPAKADFSAPAHGLFLENVRYPTEIFI